jgi:DNA-binding PadR family transcriptional regulator
VLSAALRLAVEGSVEVHGYDLFARLCEWDGEERMNHGTLYRCLSRLEQRGLFTAHIADRREGGPPRVMYQLTNLGITEAREAMRAMAGEPGAALWMHARFAESPIVFPTPPTPPTPRDGERDTGGPVT